MSFSPSGVEFVARNLRGYLSDLKQADQAQQAVGRSAAGIGGKFGQAQGQAQSFGRAVSGLGSNVAGLGSSLNGSLSSLSGFGSALSNVAQIAAGNLLASGISTFVGGVKEFISIGADAVGEAQKLEAGLGALLTQNNLYERTTKEVTVAVGNLGEMQAEAALKSEDLAFKQRELTADINRQNAAIQEQRQRIIQMADGLDKNEQVAKLQQMEIALEGMNRELVKAGQEQGKLTNIQQEYTTSTVTSYQQVNSFAEAQRLAAQQTQDLLGFVDKLSIISPFESDQVALVTKFAVGAGLAVDEAKAFTAGFLDLAAAVGIGSEELSFASDQLLQVAKVGQITTVDLRQLRRLGIDLEKIIGVQMGLSIDEFNEKAKQSPEIFQELFNGVAEFSAKTFPGAAQKLASSLGGISSTFSDIFRVGAKNLMRPFVDAVGPAVSGMLGRLSDLVTGPELAKIGQSIPKALFGAFTSLSGGGEGGFFSGLKGLGLDSSTAKAITDVTQSISELISAFQTSGFTGLAETLGISPEFITLAKNLSSSISEIVPPIKDLFTTVASYGGFGLMGLLFVNTTPDEAAAGLTSFVDELERLAGIFNQGFEAGGLQGGISAIFGDIQPQLQSLAGEILAEIPTFLTTITNSITEHFRTNVPAFQEAMAEWGPKFWEWTNNLIEGAGVALAGVLLAITAWATSPQAQTELTGMGEAIGRTIVTGLGLLFENAGELTVVLLKLSGGLLAAVAVLTGDLILIGGQIVAGIMSGILESFGLDLQPAMVSELQGILIGLAENSMTIIREVARRIVKALADAFRAVFSAGMDVGDKLVEFMDSVSDILTDPDEWLEIGEMAMQGLQNGLEKASGVVLEYLKSLLGSFLDIFTGSQGLDEHSPSRVMMDIGGDAIKGLQIGAENASGALYSSLGGITKGAINTLMTGMSVQDSGFQSQFIDDLNMGGIAKQHLVSNWPDLRDILHGSIKQNIGMLEAGASAGDITGVAQGVATQWDLPPGVMEQYVDMDTQIAHLTATFDRMSEAMRFENLKNAAGFTSQLTGVSQSLVDILKQQFGSSEEAKAAVEKLGQSTLKLTQDNTKLTGELDNQEKQMAILQQELANLNAQEEKDTLAIEKKQLAIEKLTEAMNKNKAAIQANQAVIANNQQGLAALATTGPAGMLESLRAFLEGDEQIFRMFKEFEDGTTSEFFWDRNRAQEEFNKLLREQQAQQEEIARLEKAQADLNFLQQQLSLLDLIKSKGLDPSAILGGLTLGLGASAQDLLTATNNVITAMVDQINEDLQIASPSKVMAKIGRRVMEGMVVGIDRGQNLLSDAVRGVPILNGNVPQPAFSQAAMAGAGNTYNTYYEMPMTVNTAATPQGVIRQYEIKRSMYAAA